MIMFPLITTWMWFQIITATVMNSIFDLCRPPSCAGRSRRSVEDREPGGPTCRSKRHPTFPSLAWVESPSLEDVVVLADSAGVALGVQRVFSARVGGVRDGGSGLIASRYVEIPLVGATARYPGSCARPSRGPTRAACSPPAGRREAKTIGDVAQFVVHDMNNLLAVIGSGLRLLECQGGDAAYRKAIVAKMQEAITRGALLSRRLARRCAAAPQFDRRVCRRQSPRSDSRNA